MENLTNSSKIFLNEFGNTFGDFAYIVHGFLLLISAVLIFLLSILYKNIRKKFPVKVNCWFCNNYTKVPYDFSNSWDCPHCKQYNGFNKDGGYNKVIREQFNSKLNEDVFNALKPSFSSGKNSLQSNGFCKLCNINQQLKIQQLALFVPLNEDNYYEEIEQYREKLEKAYKLCTKCEKTLQETLEKQEYNLLQDRLNGHKQNHSLLKPQGVVNLNRREILLRIVKNGILGLRWISVTIAFLLFLALVVQYETEHKFLHLTLPNYVNVEPLPTISKVALVYIREIYTFSRELSFAGFVCSLLTHFEGQVKKDHLVLLFWGLFHILLWSTLTGLQVVMSGVSLFFNSQAVQRKTICLNKKSLPKKSGFQPVKHIFPEVYNIPGEESSGLKTFRGFENGMDSGLNENTKTQEVNWKSTMEKKLRSKENEAEVPANEETKIPEPRTSDCSPGAKTTPTTSSIFSKQFLSTLETDKNEGDASGSFSDVYNNLNSLRLGEKQKKNKSSNFLFTNHNFADVKSPPSIIKPAKLIKNLSSSWTSADSNECGSRSSTPSSGYSSQKAEKIEPARYDFSKTMTPISINPFNRHSPQECFDFYGGANNGFYNNFNYCPPGFMPFQQMHGPMGHTTIYTCTRPTGFPVPFPWQGFPNQKFSPGGRFSDASDCDNLFQNASKTLEKNRKWFRLKTVSYYFSIFLNFITFAGLVYFISTGIISVDWKLPQLNFYL